MGNLLLYHHKYQYSCFNKLTRSHNNLKNFKCLNSQIISKQEKRVTVRTLIRQILFFKSLSSQIILSNHVMTSMGIFLVTLSKKKLNNINNKIQNTGIYLVQFFYNMTRNTNTVDLTN